MSLSDIRFSLLLSGFPRVSGDEPLGYVSEDGLTKFSPRERG